MAQLKEEEWIEWMQLVENDLRPWLLRGAEWSQHNGCTHRERYLLTRTLTVLSDIWGHLRREQGIGGVDDFASAGAQRAARALADARLSSGRGQHWREALRKWAAFWAEHRSVRQARRAAARRRYLWAMSSSPLCHDLRKEIALHAGPDLPNDAAR
eukprot:TRINITY_DN8661_c1_g1_i1.p3 TRINITY_DN8661_c1_g1~~TRINITY_DN8661_c1_g1_i1.p3  ORF type:complete len:156 (+),score=66.94 TRINITY_DN8661_c1_g1_i1:1100-1567(+)